MKTTQLWTALLGAILAGCGGASTLTCGEGTQQVGNECVPEESKDTNQPDPDVEPDPSDDTGESPPPDKSPKRGLAYDLRDGADFSAISGGVSWWYNWYFQSSAPSGIQQQEHMEFIPMIWGHNPESDYIALENWLLANPSTNDLLVMNEPNLVNQANLTPTAAVSHWLRYEAFQAHMLEEHGRSIRLIGPAMTWGTLANYADPLVWLTDFYTAFNAETGRDPIIDALAFHWYDYGLEEQLDRLEGFGKTFWVTEMANWHTADDWTIDTPEKQMATMIDMVAICEAREDVERYAWFIGRWDPDPHYTSIFESESGKLTALGEAYIAQPW